MSPSLAHARKHSLSAPCDTFHQPRGTGQGARNASVSVTNQHSRFYTPNSLFTQGVSVARSRGHCFAGWRRRRQPSHPPGRDRPALRVGLPKGCLTHGCSISRFNKNPSLSVSPCLCICFSLARSLARSRHMVLTCTLSHLTGEMKTTVVVRHVSLSARHSTVHSPCPALPAFTTLTPACTSCAAARQNRQTRHRTHRCARQPKRARNT